MKEMIMSIFGKVYGVSGMKGFENVGLISGIRGMLVEFKAQGKVSGK